jgi:predicted metal-dependent phosphoesterase TrpH
VRCGQLPSPERLLPGVEVTTADGHLLCIGAELPYLKGKPAREVCDIIHQRGGLAIPPHPYDLFRAGIRFSTLETLPVDAIEVFNAATTLRRYNRYAFKYAQIRSLPMRQLLERLTRSSIPMIFP